MRGFGMDCMQVSGYRVLQVAMGGYQGTVWRGGVVPTNPATLSDLSHPLSMPGVCFQPSKEIVLQVPLVLCPAPKLRVSPENHALEELSTPGVLSAQGKATSNVSVPTSGGRGGEGPSGSPFFGSCAYSCLLPGILCSPYDYDRCLC